MANRKKSDLGIRDASKSLEMIVSLRDGRGKLQEGSLVCHCKFCRCIVPDNAREPLTGSR
jgi:hypothetical protein